jgi:hypothetical protein
MDYSDKPVQNRRLDYFERRLLPHCDKHRSNLPLELLRQSKEINSIYLWTVHVGVTWCIEVQVYKTEIPSKKLIK